MSDVCLLYPQKRTLAGDSWMSALCQKQTFCAAARKNLDTKCLYYTKALSPVIALPTINVFISRVPS